MLKATVKNAYGDWRYEEVSKSEEKGEYKTFEELDAGGTWAVKQPSEACVAAVTERVQGSQVLHFNNVPYLLSPKAQQYFVRPSVNSESVALSFKRGQERCFVLVKPKNRDRFENLTVPQYNLDQTQALQQALQECFNLNVNIDRFTPHGFWSVVLHSNQVIDYETYIYFHLFHSQLTMKEVYDSLVHVSAKVTKVQHVKGPIVLQCNPTCKYSCILLLPQKDIKKKRYMVASTHYQNLLRLCGNGKDDTHKLCRGVVEHVVTPLTVPFTV